MNALKTELRYSLDIQLFGEEPEEKGSEKDIILDDWRVGCIEEN